MFKVQRKGSAECLRLEDAEEVKVRKWIRDRSIRLGSVVNGTISPICNYKISEEYYEVLVDGLQCQVSPSDIPNDWIDRQQNVDCGREYVVIGYAHHNVPCSPYYDEGVLGKYLRNDVFSPTLKLCEKSVFVERCNKLVGKVVHLTNVPGLQADPKLGLKLCDFAEVDWEYEEDVYREGLFEVVAFSPEDMKITISEEAAKNRIYRARVTDIYRKGLAVDIIAPFGEDDYIGEMNYFIPKKHVDINPVKDIYDYLYEEFSVKVLSISCGEVIFSRRLFLEEEARRRPSNGSEIPRSHESNSATVQPSKVVVDGKNIIAYGSNRKAGVKLCHVSYLDALITALEAARLPWFCFLDANTPIYVSEVGTKNDKRSFDALLAKYADRLVCVNGGHEADDDILFKADRENCDVISCDNFQKPKYLERYPWLRIKDEHGHYLDGVPRRVHSFLVAEGDLVVQSLGISAALSSSDEDYKKSRTSDERNDNKNTKTNCFDIDAWSIISAAPALGAKAVLDLYRALCEHNCAVKVILAEDVMALISETVRNQIKMSIGENIIVTKDARNLGSIVAHAESIHAGIIGNGGYKISYKNSGGKFDSVPVHGFRIESDMFVVPSLGFALEL